MPVRTFLTDFWSAQRAGLPASFTVSWEEPFDTADQVGSRHFQRVGNFKNGRERRTVFAALEKADVLWVVAALERQFFLREPTILPKLVESACKSSSFRKIALGCSRHPQRGVCCEPINSSTKYSLPNIIADRGLNVARSADLEAA
jgi:hypothetical protein